MKQVQEQKKYTLDSGYEALAYAIVEQAVKDYRTAKHKLENGICRSYKDKNLTENILKDCKNFFNSEWFLNLTDVDGQKILKRLDN